MISHLRKINVDVAAMVLITTAAVGLLCEAATSDEDVVGGRPEREGMQIPPAQLDRHEG